MAKDLPGFYYDAEKNRYFPCRGPIPGSSPRPSHTWPPPRSPPKQAIGSTDPTKLRQVELLQARELSGKMISSHKGKLSFQAECQKRRVSRPLIWKYKGTEKMANIALEHEVVDVTSPCGIIEREVLLGSGVNGSLCLFQAGRTEEESDPAQIYELGCVWPLSLGQKARHEVHVRQLWSSSTMMMHMPSDISCIKMAWKRSQPTNDIMSKHFVITTLGSDCAPGSVYLLDLSNPLDFDSGVTMASDRFYELAAFKQTLWTADCNPKGGHIVIGTNKGAVLLNMETRVSSWVLRCKSDVLSVQFDASHNLILCGLRNGAIETVDTRQKQVKWNMRNSFMLSMPSSVCCLASLKRWDQYFLASSMDGSIKLYDHRLTQRGPVQTYEGSVNSHTRIGLGVDPSETIVVSGGEDCYLRIWSIKSGELLFKEVFMSSAPSALCWPRTEEKGQDSRCYRQNYCWGAWLGSYEGIFYMDWE